MSQNTAIPIDEAAAGECAAALGALGYYPKEPGARTLIATAILEICRTTEDATWLVKRVVQLHATWSTCGVKGLWQIWFSKHPPRNEKERVLELLTGVSESYPDGVPSEKTPELLESKPMLALPEGCTVSANAEDDKLILETAATVTLPPLPKYYARSPDEIRVDKMLRAMYNLPVEEEPVKKAEP